MMHPDAENQKIPVPLATGLGNRLWNITCLATIAESTGQRFEPVWMRTADFGGRFIDLFEPLPAGALPFAIHDDAPPLQRSRLQSPADVIGAHLSGLVHREVTQWKLLWARDLDPRLAPFRARCVEWFSLFRPSQPLAARIEQFRRHHFRPTMIGVHLRRGDFLRVHPRCAANDAEAIRQIEAHLAADPAAGILLVTDDGVLDPVTREARSSGVRERFLDRYGDRVVIPPCHSVDRATVTAAEDAVTDLWLLRHVDRFIGTEGSTYSAMASLGRGIPATMCVGQAPERPPSG